MSTKPDMLLRRFSLPGPRTMLPLLAVLIPLTLASCSEEALPVSSEPIGVRVVPAMLTPDLVTEQATGEIRARVETRLSFNASGRIVSRDVEAGDRVNAGQRLALLDDTEQKADVASAEAAISAQEATLRVAESYLNRRRTLTQTGVLSQQDLDQAIQQYESAVSDLAAAKARLATAQNSLKQTELRANADGVITTSNVERGEVVQPSTDVFTLAHAGELDAVFNVQEAVFTRDSYQPDIEVSLVQRPEIQSKAKVREVSPTIDRQMGTVRVKLEIENPPPEMTLGSAVVAHVRLLNGERIFLPWQALTSLNGEPAVWIVNATDDTVEMRKVDIDRYDTDRIVLSGGVSPGEQVVVEGVQFLRPKQKVSVRMGASS